MNKYATITFGSMLLAVAFITACSSGEKGSDSQPPPPAAPAAPTATNDAGLINPFTARI
jgi:hypothetical protein